MRNTKDKERMFRASLKTPSIKKQISNPKDASHKSQWPKFKWSKPLKTYCFEYWDFEHWMLFVFWCLSFEIFKDAL